MIHWFAGAKPPEANDPDASALIEAPETPAPVFAVRAFKHAIFGTPQQSPHPRRHSNTDRDRQRQTVGSRSNRPQITRPKSAGDAAALGRQQGMPEPMPSPTKGILMTPGTAAARRKTVTFGDYVVDNEKAADKDDIFSGSPNKTPKGTELKPQDGGSSDRKRGRSKLTEDLRRVREESEQRKHAESANGTIDEQALDDDFEEPTSEAGKYWKNEYDVYRENTTREVKKLLSKQKAAKSYARDKDLQCTDLSDQLRQEKKKIERLERRNAELEAQLKALGSHAEETRATSPTKSSRLLNRRSKTSDDLPTTDASSAPTRSHPIDEQSAVVTESGSPIRPTSSDTYQPRATRSRANLTQEEPQSIRASRTRHQPGNLPTDLWSQNHTTTRSGGRAVTSGTGLTDLTPLKHISVNPQPSITRTDASPSPKRSTFDRQDSYPKGEEATAGAQDAEPPFKRRDSLDLPRPAGEERKPKKIPHTTSPLLPSSPFQAEPSANPADSTASASTLPLRPATTRGRSKENLSPSRAAAMPTAVKEVKDVGVTVGAAKREKNASQLSADRMAAAKARLMAKGVRNVS